MRILRERHASRDARAIQPLHDRVLVRRLPRRDRRFSDLIHVPDNYQGEFQEDATEHYGEVVAVGPGRRMVEGPKGVAGKFLYKSGGRRPVAVKPGDRVWWGRFSDWVEGDLEMIMEGDIVAVDESPRTLADVRAFNAPSAHPQTDPIGYSLMKSTEANGAVALETTA